MKFLLAATVICTFLQRHYVCTVTSRDTMHTETSERNNDDIADSYIAAVYEHKPQVLRPVSRERLRQTLDIYEQVVKEAAQKEANIVVFPEDGIMAFGDSRDAIYPYLEMLPKLNVKTNPCEKIATERREIQQRLSCMAKSYNVYLVANVGTVQFCNASEPCPPDGRFQYNTNVVFDTTGNLVSYYHKWNLFGELTFDFPVGPEYATFDTPYGKFATIVCFDILFKEPAVDLVEKHGVTNIIMPTAWRSILPEMSGIGYHESWARRMGVNLLTSELHFAVLGFVGSGIYAGAIGALNYSNKYTIFSSSELLISTVATTPMPCIKSPLPAISHISSRNNTDYFQAKMEGNLFTFMLIKPDSDTLVLHSENTTCYLEYRYVNRDPREIYAFGIFDGLHLSELNSSIQVCALVKCAGLSPETCGTPTREAQSTFSYVHLQGQFSTDYIFPSMLTNQGNLATNWSFTLDEATFRGRITANSTREPLSVILYTRVFQKDKNVIPRYYHTNHTVTDNKYTKSYTQVDTEKEAHEKLEHSPGGHSFVLILVFIFVSSVAGLASISVICNYKIKYKSYSDYELIDGVSAL